MNSERLMTESNPKNGHMIYLTVKYIPDAQERKIYYVLINTSSEIYQLPYNNQSHHLIFLRNFYRFHPRFVIELKQASDTLTSSLIHIHRILIFNYTPQNK